MPLFNCPELHAPEGICPCGCSKTNGRIYGELCRFVRLQTQSTDKCTMCCMIVCVCVRVRLVDESNYSDYILIELETYCCLGR